ncbi:MAG: sigma-70 family RNA polymerase sigma factor [Ktedonobacterales bacterium]
MEPPIRLYRPNGSGGQRRSVARPAKRPKVADHLEAEPATEAVPAPKPEKPARRTRAPKRDPGAKAVATKVLTDEHSPQGPGSAPQPETSVASELVGDRSEWAEEPGPVVGIEDFEDIFTRFQTPLTNFVYRLVGNREQAYDLTQDVFVKAYRALSSGTTIQAAALSSWLYRIASNTATDALRRRRLISWLPLSLFNEDRGVGAGMPGADNTSSTPQTFAEENLPSSGAAFASNYDGGRFEQRVADREIVQSILQRLPPKYATCLLLYEHEGFSCAEIAEVLNVSPSAVKMRLMRARERFIALYKQETGA